MSLPLSGADFPAERKRRRDQDGVMRVRPSAEKPQEPSEPSTRDLLLALTARIEGAEARAEERHAELLRKIEEVGDDASSASSTAYEVKRELDAILYPPYPG